MTVAQKMSLLVASALIGIILLAGTAQVQINKVFEQTNYSNVNVIPSLAVLSKIQDNLYRTRLRLDRHVINTDSSQFERLEKNMNEAIDATKQGFSEYKNLITFV